MRRADRKYADPTYRATRAALAAQVEAGECTCVITTDDHGQTVGCGRPIHPGQKWDLGHGAGGVIAGPQHSRCNRAAGARNGNRARARAKLRTTIEW